ncbi:MAG: hypothetical protein LQ349_008214, partial [Xanthoria aureola]
GTNPPYRERPLPLQILALLLLLLLPALWLNALFSFATDQTQQLLCSQMTPPNKLWTFPPRLSVADRAFQSQMIDYEHDYNLDHSQILTDLDTQFLKVDAAIDAAIEQLDGRLACTLTRVLTKDNNQPNSSIVLTEEIGVASQTTTGNSPVSLGWRSWSRKLNGSVTNTTPLLRKPL